MLANNIAGLVSGLVLISSFCTTHLWQLDLRCGAKKSLADLPKHPLALKSCDISSVRPHQILVGGR